MKLDACSGCMDFFKVSAAEVQSFCEACVGEEQCILKADQLTRTHGEARRMQRLHAHP
jgi:hypothetical protein